MNDQQYRKHCLELLSEFAQTMVTRTEHLPPDDSLRELAAAFETSCALEGSRITTRADEVDAHLETVRIFGDLAIARLDLVMQLKKEVELQAAEIASITSRRLNAEFVRNVAHELRKPTEEIRCLAASLEKETLQPSKSVTHSG